LPPCPSLQGLPLGNPDGALYALEQLLPRLDRGRDPKGFPYPKYSSFHVASLATVSLACPHLHIVATRYLIDPRATVSQGCAKRTDLAHCTRILRTIRYTAYCHAFLYASRGVRICARPLRKYGGLRVTCPRKWVHFHATSDNRRVTFVHVDTAFQNSLSTWHFPTSGSTNASPAPSFLREGA
jgi:hypothetical protein